MLPATRIVSSTCQSACCCRPMKRCGSCLPASCRRGFRPTSIAAVYSSYDHSTTICGFTLKERRSVYGAPAFASRLRTLSPCTRRREVPTMLSLQICSGLRTSAPPNIGWPVMLCCLAHGASMVSWYSDLLPERSSLLGLRNTYSTSWIGWRISKRPLLANW